MTRDETVTLLRLRWQLTELRFGDSTVDAWVQALHDVTATDATTASRSIIARGETVTVASIRSELAGRRRPETTPSASERWDCDCRQDGATVALCDYHRELGLRHIAALRATGALRGKP